MVLGLREIKEGTLDSLTSRACNIRKQGHFRFFFVMYEGEGNDEKMVSRGPKNGPFTVFPG